jgi:tetratricopeptide (TPR) repeat protein
MKIARAFVRPRAWLPFFLTALLLLCACSRSSRISRHLNRGETFFKAEQFDKAEIEFLNVLRIEATNAIALRQLGFSYYQQGRLLQAYAFLQEAARTDPANDDVRVRLAGILLASRKLKEARAQAEVVLLRNPANEEALMLVADTATSEKDITELRQHFESLRPAAEKTAGFHLALGTLQLRQQHTNEALADFQRALALNPKSSPAHLALGNVFALLKDNGRADLHLKTASELAPIRSPRRIQYADFKLQSGDLTAAKAHLQSITKQAPDYLLPYVRLAEISLTERRFDEAASLVKKILARDHANYEAMLLLGRISMARGEPAQALTQFERLAAAYPRVPHAHHQLALALLMNKNQLKAIGSLHQALALEPRHTESILLLAELNIRKNDVGSAIAALQQLVKEQPEVAQSHLLLANAYRVQRDLDAAINVYEKMIRIFPSRPQPHFLWGQILLQQQKKPEARKKFERAAELAPDFLPPLEELVDLDIQDKRFRAAEKRVQAYSEKYPKAAAPFLFLARVYSAQTNHLGAEQALAHAIELDPGYQAAYLALARVYVSSNKQQEAIDKLKVVLAQSTNNVAAWMQLGMIHNELKDYAAAREAYEKLLTVDSRFFPALNNLAYLYSERFNQLDKAYNMARAVRDLRPFDPVVADTLGWILFKRGEYPWALSLLQESANSDRMPKSAEVLFHLGMTHYMLGEEQLARNAFQRALEIRQDFPGKAEAEQRLAFLLGSSPETTSLAALERQVEANPRDPILLHRLASLYEQSGSFEKAAGAYQQALQHNSKNIPAMVKLARLYAGPLKNQARAMQMAQEAHALAPEDPQIRHTIGRLAFQAGDHKWSLILLQDSARKLNDPPEVLYDLAWAAYSMGQITEAEAAMKKTLIKSNPAFNRAADAKQFVELIAVHLKPETARTAESRIAAALKQDPGNIPAVFASGILQEQAGNPAAARDQYLNVLKRFPSFSAAHKRLAIVLAETDPTTAYEHAAKARAALPDDPEVARTLGILSFHREEYVRASQLLTESSRKLPGDAEAFYYLGMAHYHCRENPEAAEALRCALAKDPGAVFAPEAKRILGELK